SRVHVPSSSPFLLLATARPHHKDVRFMQLPKWGLRNFVERFFRQYVLPAFPFHNHPDQALAHVKAPCDCYLGMRLPYEGSFPLHVRTRQLRARRRAQLIVKVLFAPLWEVCPRLPPHNILTSVTNPQSLSPT